MELALDGDDRARDDDGDGRDEDGRRALEARAEEEARRRRAGEAHGPAPGAAGRGAAGEAHGAAPRAAVDVLAARIVERGCAGGRAHTLRFSS